MTGISPPNNPAKDHVIILDGTNSSLASGFETNAGLLYKLLLGQGGRADQTLYYEPGIQWANWLSTGQVLRGVGTNRIIRRAYGALASRYRPGDRIFLFGFSRGAYAVRSLAGVIDMIGLLRAEAATPRLIREIYRHYQMNPYSQIASIFSQRHCHAKTPIELVGVWDTVKALGLRLPILWQFTEPRHAFHNHALGASIRHGFHALAMHETREAYAPVLWRCPADYPGHMQQVWFRGAHGDIGGQLGGFESARGLSNIPLVWMIDRTEMCGLGLPQDWRERFPQDPEAPAVGSWRGWGKFFLARKKRVIGQDISEEIHPTALGHIGLERSANEGGRTNPL